MKYTKEYIRELFKEMKTATGSRLVEIGEEFDVLAPVLYHGDAPRFSEVGARGIIAWGDRPSEPPDRTPLDNASGTKKRVFSSI